MNYLIVRGILIHGHVSGEVTKKGSVDHVEKKFAVYVVLPHGNQCVVNWYSIF